MVCHVYLQDINIMKNKKVKKLKDDQDAISDPNIGLVGIEPMASMY